MVDCLTGGGAGQLRSCARSNLSVFTITPVLQLYPDTLVVTNSWAFAGDHDLAGVEVGGEHAEGGVLTLHFRRDKKVSEQV
jgi:hypothetical protein